MSLIVVMTEWLVDRRRSIWQTVSTVTVLPDTLTVALLQTLLARLVPVSRSRPSVAPSMQIRLVLAGSFAAMLLRVISHSPGR